jgi:hypothetical protein
MIYTGSGSHPGGFGRYSTIDPLSMRQAHFLAAVFPNPDWRWPVMVSVVESFLLRSYRNQGAVNHYAQRYGTIFGVRMVDHWYLPVEACIALWTSCNLLPNLAFTTHGTNCWTFNDFWLAGGNKILADVPLYDVTIFNEGRFTCLRFTLVEPPTAGTDVSVPQASRESVVHGVVTYEPNRPTMSFALD